MKKFLIVIVFIFIALIIFFQYPPQPVGIYIAKNNINTIDSLIIKENGEYVRMVYNEDGTKMMFKNSSKWSYEDGRLLFRNFFPNDDKKLIEGYNYESVLMTFSVPLEKSIGRTVFDYNETTGKYQFYKTWF